MSRNGSGPGFSPSVVGAIGPDGIGYPLFQDSDGNLLVSSSGGGGGGTSSDFNAAFPVAGTAIGASDGTDMVPLLVDPATGRLLIAGSFSATPVQSNTASAPSIVSVAASDTAGIAANGSRKSLNMKNVGTQPVLVFYGAGPATAASYHDILQPGGTSKDGFGQQLVDLQWTGAIRFYCVGGAGVVSIWENT